MGRDTEAIGGPPRLDGAACDRGAPVRHDAAETSPAEEAFFPEAPQLADAQDILQRDPAENDAIIASLPDDARAAVLVEAAAPLAGDTAFAARPEPDLPGGGAGAATAELYEFQSSLSDYLSFRTKYINRDIGLDLSSDGCSVPTALQKNIKLAAGYSKKFNNPCLRHDFGYRNLGGKSGNHFDPRQETRERIDKVLLADARAYSSTDGDRAAARVFYEAVRTFGWAAY